MLKKLFYFYALWLRVALNKAINTDSISVASFLCLNGTKTNQLQFAGYSGVMHKLEMSKLQELNQRLGQIVSVGVRLGFVAWVFGILGWCIARLIDRSEWLIGSALISPDWLNWYVNILFFAFPVICSICGCYLMRRVKPRYVAALFSVAVACFVWVG